MDAVVSEACEQVALVCSAASGCQRSASEPPIDPLDSPSAPARPLARRRAQPETEPDAESDAAHTSRHIVIESSAVYAIRRHRRRRTHRDQITQIHVDWPISYSSSSSRSSSDSQAAKPANRKRRQAELGSPLLGTRRAVDWPEELTSSSFRISDKASRRGTRLD